MKNILVAFLLLVCSLHSQITGFTLDKIELEAGITVKVIMYLDIENFTSYDWALKFYAIGTTTPLQNASFKIKSPLLTKEFKASKYTLTSIQEGKLEEVVVLIDSLDFFQLFCGQDLIIMINEKEYKVPKKKIEEIFKLRKPKLMIS